MVGAAGEVRAMAGDGPPRLGCDFIRKGLRSGRHPRRGGQTAVRLPPHRNRPGRHSSRVLLSRHADRYANRHADRNSEADVVHRHAERRSDCGTDADARSHCIAPLACPCLLRRGVVGVVRFHVSRVRSERPEHSHGRSACQRELWKVAGFLVGMVVGSGQDLISSLRYDLIIQP
jgi:hypothetical protein